MTLFRAIYNNHLGMQDKMVEYWNFVSQSLSSNEYVVGFDPFNEPFPAFSGLSSLVDLMMPGHYDR
jgi:hypothetical protein